MTTLGCVLCSRNDNYGGDLINKFKYALSSMLYAMDEVYYIDWNSSAKTLFDEVRNDIPVTGKLHVITITPSQAIELTKKDINAQFCCEVLARNIGIRRLTADYIISTNSDIVFPTRENILNGIIDQNTFHTIARCNTEFSHLTESGLRYDSPLVGEFIVRTRSYTGQFGDGSPLGAVDKWSLISCPGDFQLAHRDLWYAIKGFDENLIYRGYADSNVQRKADYYGFKQALVRNITAVHLNHYPGGGSCGGNSAAWNDGNAALLDYKGTQNTDNWGFADRDFNEEIL